jgi:hypothetical protein
MRRGLPVISTSWKGASMRTLFFIILTITSGCPSSDPVADACKRLDECNALNGSVEECTQDTNAAVNQLAPSRQDEFRQDLESCLSHATCEAFTTCIDNLGN